MNGLFYRTLICALLLAPDSFASDSCSIKVRQKCLNVTLIDQGDLSNAKYYFRGMVNSALRNLSTEKAKDAFISELAQIKFFIRGESGGGISVSDNERIQHLINSYIKYRKSERDQRIDSFIDMMVSTKAKYALVLAFGTKKEYAAFYLQRLAGMYTSYVEQMCSVAKLLRNNESDKSRFNDVNKLHADAMHSIQDLVANARKSTPIFHGGMEPDFNVKLCAQKEEKCIPCRENQP